MGIFKRFLENYLYFFLLSCFFSLNLDKQTTKGSTALHYCCLTDNSECLKLLLRGKASIDIGEKMHQREYVGLAQSSSSC